MDKLMQSLFNYITDCTLEKYYEPTGVRRYWEERDAIGRALWEQLPPEQKLELEALQRAYDRAQMAELEAMFLASFDQIIAMHLPHCPQPAVPAAPPVSTAGPSRAAVLQAPRPVWSAKSRGPFTGQGSSSPAQRLRRPL